MPQKHLVEIRKASVNRGTLQTLAPVSAVLDAGGALVITGPNGSGKTTLIRAMLGRVELATGEIFIDGVQTRPHRANDRAVASLLGAPPFYRDLTVREHIQLVAASWGETACNADELVDRLGARHILGQFPSELSSGETQLTALICALVRPSSIIVLDEPEQRLDTDRRAELARLLIERMHEGTGLVLVSHDASIANAVAAERGARRIRLEGRGV